MKETIKMFNNWQARDIMRIHEDRLRKTRRYRILSIVFALISLFFFILFCVTYKG